MDEIKKDENSFSKLLAVLKQKTKVDFTYYKPATVIRRISRRMGLVQVGGVEEYIEYIYRNPREISALFKDLLIGVTRFFRDTESFRILSQRAIPTLIATARARQPAQLRIWDVGCATGEEAYSIAMLVRDALDEQGVELDVKIFATDIDQDAVEFAGLGVYPESIAADMDVRFLSKHFDKLESGYRIKKNIRQMVIFALHNIIQDPPFTKIDLIVCRNLLIYLQPVLQKNIFHSFLYVLQQDGILFLGKSETVVAHEAAFEAIDAKQRIYRHVGHGDLPVPATVIAPATREFSLAAARVAYDNRGESLHAARTIAYEKYFHEVIGRIVDALLVVNETRELVQSFGNTGKFLNLPSGNVSLDILSMLPRELSLAVSSAMQKVRKDKARVVYNNIRVAYGATFKRIHLCVDLLPGGLGRNLQLFMIRLEEEIDPDRAGSAQATERDYLAEERISDLEKEVLFTRENLQATIEELQTTNEELQATNEELLAANEELQSTNEELQSVNEELNTVNAEYQNKVLELTELNTDMNNLMTSSDIPTIFLDKELRIRKFSHAMTRELSLLEQDIGRPLTDLNVSMFGRLRRDADRVIMRGVAVEKTIHHGKEWYLQRILPFIDDRGDVGGVVLTLVKITDQKNAELAWEEQHNLLQTILNASPSPTIRVDRQGEILFANDNAGKIFGVQRQSLLGMKINGRDFPFTDLDERPIGAEEGPLARLLATESSVERYIMSLRRNNGSKIVICVTANPTFNKKNQVDGAVFRMDAVAYEDVVD